MQFNKQAQQKLELYIQLLNKWNAKINLVSPATLPKAWERHILDSAQIFPFIENHPGPLLDMGSGAGFPGMVLAMMGKNDVHLVESDVRKTVFLQEVSRESKTPVHIHNTRIENIAPQPFEIITSRALADLKTLLNYARPFLSQNTICAFLKGENAKKEIEDTKKDWQMDIESVTSMTSEDGQILLIKNLRGTNHD